MNRIVKDKMTWVIFSLHGGAQEVPCRDPGVRGGGKKMGKRGETSAVRLCLILISLLWLASLEMSRFTVINLLTHLTQQSVMEEAGVIRIEPPG